ncbi:MAG: alpha/beta hydrolase [Clostridiales bacterium]|nr:alpha/beta hydrolase [Clostridiales bacterium]
MKEKRSRKPHRNGWWIALAVVAAVGVACAVVWTHSTVLQRAAVRFVCSLGTGKQQELAFSSVDTLLEDVSYESRFENGCLDLYARQSDTVQPLIVYAHGGYYIGGDKSSMTDYCRLLASRGYVVANINYMLAPEAKYPTQILQVNEAVSFLLKHAADYGIDPLRVFIGGDSAGGHLSSQMGLYYTDPDFQREIGDEPALSAEQLRGVILHCGYYNTDTVRATGFPMIADSIWMLTGVKDYEGTTVSEQMNTVKQISPDYPAVFIDCGDQDPFITQAHEMIDALHANGVEVVSYLPVTSQMPLMHEFQMQLSWPEAQEAMELLAGFLGERSK